MNQEKFKVTSAEELLLLGNVYVASRALHTVAQMKIADLFEGKSESVESLAQKRGLSPLALKRILRVLSPFGIFNEDDDGSFSLTEIGCMLKSGHPSMMRNLLYCEDCRWNSFGQMSNTTKTGKTGFSKLYEKEYFEYISQIPELQEGFDRHMKAVSKNEDRVIAAKLPLQTRKQCTDIGCGKAGLLSAVLDCYPQIKGGAFELPGVAEEDIDKLSKKYQGRIEVFSGSFFDALPFCSDSIILKRILHDWDDERCVEILSRCREALTETGEIYIVESILKGKQDPLLLRIFDLLLLTVFGGFERSLEEYKKILFKSGLKVQYIISTEVPMSVIVCSKS